MSTHDDPDYEPSNWDVAGIVLLAVGIAMLFFFGKL